MPATALVWNTLIILVLIAVAVYVVVKVQRARREHRARSEERAASMLLALQTQTALARPVATAPGTQPAPAPRPAPSTPAATAAPGPLTRRPRVLTDTQRLLYLVLRAAMPDHAVMANMRIVDLVEGVQSAEAIERDARLRELARERTDFIVCTSDLTPIAALVIYETGIAAVPDESVKVAALRELGVKFLRFRADSLPRPAEVRGLILG